MTRGPAPALAAGEGQVIMNHPEGGARIVVPVEAIGLLTSEGWVVEPSPDVGADG